RLPRHVRAVCRRSRCNHRRRTGKLARRRRPAGLRSMAATHSGKTRIGGHNNMTIKEGAFRRQAAKLTAIVLVLVVYGFARVPTPTESELVKLAEGFHFSAAPLPTMNGETQQTIRNVNPSLRRIAGWVSSVGAAVALNDLDGDGLPNDVCHVD